MMLPLRVLIVEDSADDTMLLVLELRRGDYDVTFERVDSAAAMTGALDATEWDLIVCDYSMPHFSGNDALRLLRSKGTDIPFIFLSGTIGEDTAVEALKQGAQDYLMKGNLSRLLPAIRRALEEARLRREAMQLREQVQQLEKFEYIGRLAGGVAHDFNNALAIILGWTELCHDNAPAGSELGDRLQKIRAQTERAGVLTSQLLAFSRREVFEPRKVSLNRLITDTVDFLKSVIGEQIVLELDLAEDLTATEADSAQIERVVMNLCLNARDAMPEGGRLVIQTSNLEIGEELRKVAPAVQPGRFVRMSISDTGIGMDSRTKTQIFDPFFTTKELGRGTGLGLATVYGIVQHHKGFLTVDSQLEIGSTFHVHLPSSSGIPGALEAELTGVRMAGTGTETILVAEDHECLRELAQQALSSQGYKVILACNGEEAVSLFKQNSEEIHLALLDISMPFLSGPEAYAQMLVINPDLPVIFTSGHTASMVPHVQAGEAFLQKPYPMKTLGYTIRSVLDQALVVA